MENQKVAKLLGIDKHWRQTSITPENQVKVARPPGRRVTPRRHTKWVDGSSRRPETPQDRDRRIHTHCVSKRWSSQCFFIWFCLVHTLLTCEWIFRINESCTISGTVTHRGILWSWPLKWSDAILAILRYRPRRAWNWETESKQH